MKNRSRTALVSLPLLAAILAGCGDDSSAGGRDETAGGLTLDDLHGRVFEGASLDSPDRALVPGTAVRLGFDGAELSAHAGCNHLFGTLDLAGDRLTASDVGSTEMGCDQARHDQDAWLVGFLSRGPRLALAGGVLTLDGGGTTLELTEVPASTGTTGDPDLPTSDSSAAPAG